MLRLGIRLTLCLLAFVLQSSAFVPIAPQQQIRSPTQMSMIFGPKQALAIEKRKDPKKFESTINGLMKVRVVGSLNAFSRIRPYFTIK